MINQLNQIVNDSRLTSYHVSLYMAIFVEQIANPSPLVVNRVDLMKTGKVRSKDKFFECIHQLHEWGFIDYRRGHRYSPSTVCICPAFGTNEYCQIPENRNCGNVDNSIIPESRIDEWGIIPENRTDANRQIPENRTDATFIIPESRTDEHYQIPENRNYDHNQIPENRTDERYQIPDFGTDESRNNRQIPEIRTDEFSQDIDNEQDKFAMPKTGHSKNSPPPPPSSSYKSNKNNLLLKKNDVDDGGDVGDDVGGPSYGRQKSKKMASDHPFSQSPYFDWLAFEAAFAESNRKENIDLRYYHEALKDWRDRESGLPPLRSDWLRTARVFMRNDAKHGKLVLQKNMTFDGQAPLPPKHPLIINNEKYRRT